MNGIHTPGLKGNRKKLLFAALVFAAALCGILALRAHRRSRYPTVTLTDMSVLPLTDMKFTSNGRFEAEGEDGYVEIMDLGYCVESLEVNCAWISRKPSFEPSTMQIYYNTGEGYNESESVRVRIKNGSCRATIDTDKVIYSLRLDLFDVVGNSVTVQSIVLNPGLQGNLAAAGCVAALLFLSLCALAFFTDFRRFAVLAVGEAVILFACAFPAVYYSNPQIRDEFVVTAVLSFAVFAVAVVMPETGKKHAVFTLLLMLLGFFIYYRWAKISPIGQGPDESMHYDVVDFITTWREIPRGDDPRIRSEIWGFSYAFSPILPFMIGSLFQIIVSFFTDNEFTLLMAARMVSILAGCGTIFFVSRTAALLFPKKRAAYMFPVFIACYPELAFLFTYVNSDGFAIFTTSMIVYFWVTGIQNSWRIRDGVGLSAAMALCALTYYNCYGFILMSIPLFFFSIFHTERSRSYILKLTGGIVLMTAVMCGWWFIRNAILYNGDFLARHALNEAAELYALEEFKPSAISTPYGEGRSLGYMLFTMDWLKNTYLSFINMFSHYVLPGRAQIRRIFTGFFLAGGLSAGLFLVNRIRGWKKRGEADVRKTVFHINMLFAMVIPFILALIYSYANDYQPQGRYIMPCIVPLGYFLVAGFDELDGLLDRLKEKGGAVLRALPCEMAGAAAMVLSLSALANTFLDTVFPYYI